MRNTYYMDDSVQLPGGLMLEDGAPLRDVLLRPLSGSEEDWLAHHPRTPSAPAVTRLLGSCLARSDGTPLGQDLARRLLVGDRDYLMLQLRRLTLGERVSAALACPACSARMDVDFNAGDVPVEWRPQQEATYTMTIGREATARRQVRYRLPTGADQEAVLRLNGPEAVDMLFSRCLLDDGGVALTPDERTTVIDVMEELAPRLDLELDVTCPECGHSFEVPFDTTAFFLAEIRGSRQQLLREVHILAFYYHWSEADILDLPRERRRSYLSLLSDALRQD